MARSTRRECREGVSELDEALNASKDGFSEQLPCPVPPTSDEFRDCQKLSHLLRPCRVERAFNGPEELVRICVEQVGLKKHCKIRANGRKKFLLKLIAVKKARDVQPMSTNEFTAKRAKI